jgi:hypothetical protein
MVMGFCTAALGAGCFGTDGPDPDDPGGDPPADTTSDTGQEETGMGDADTGAAPDTTDTGMPPEDTSDDTGMGLDGSSDTGIDTTADTTDEVDTGDDTETDADNGMPAPTPDSVIVTEFMSNPEALSDSEGEYIELYNTSGTETYNLDGCAIKDLDSDDHTISASGGNLLIPPNSYLTLARSNMPGFSPDYVYGSWFLAGDDEIILECDGQTVDEVDYKAFSGGPNSGAGYGLNPQRLSAAANDIDGNWCDQTSSLPGSSDKGTPGMANDSCMTAMPGPNAPQNAGELVISEFMADPDKTSDSDGEWFEIHNPDASTTYDINGCIISDRGSDQHRISTQSGSLEIPPGGNITLARSAMPGFTPDYVYDSSWGLTNGGDEILLNCAGTLIDEVDYANGTNWGADPTTPGAAKGVDPVALTATSNDDANNWCDQTSALPNNMDKGTPGAMNDSCTP